MNHDEPNTELSPCSQVEAAIQELLDGEPPTPTPALDLHRATCAHCRMNYRAAQQLAAALTRVPRPTASPAWTDRVVHTILTDAASTRKTLFANSRSLWWLAAAACLLLMLGLAQPWSERGPLLRLFAGRNQPPMLTARTDQPPAPEVAEQSPNAVPLRERWETASSALASLTKRTADQTLEPTRKLLPSQMEPPSLNVADRYPLAIDPAAHSLQEVRQGAAASLEPMANSARRAFSMLLREASMNSESKNDF